MSRRYHTAHKLQLRTTAVCVAGKERPALLMARRVRAVAAGYALVLAHCGMLITVQCE